VRLEFIASVSISPQLDVIVNFAIDGENDFPVFAHEWLGAAI